MVHRRSRRLTVLVNAGPWLPVPPRGYGGIETVLSVLIPELRRAGVRVVLAGVATSSLEVDRLVPTSAGERLGEITAPYNRSSGVAHAHMVEVVRALREDPTIDLVHDHLEVVGPSVLAAMGAQAPPVLQTLHWDLRKHPDFYERFDGGGRVFFAGVSDHQVSRAPARLRRQVVGVVPLAVTPPPAAPLPGDAALPGPDDADGGAALVLARITRDKGQDLAVAACRRAGVPLVLAGPVAGVGDPQVLARRLADPRDPLHSDPDALFWAEEVAPSVDGEQVRWVGTVAGEAKEDLLRRTRALLVPNRWAEPGATGVVEALSRGVPVVATPLGVLPSLVEHGTTGLLAEDVEGLADALRRVGDLDRAACRAAAGEWTPAAMASRYLDLYARVLDLAGGPGAGPARVAAGGLRA